MLCQFKDGKMTTKKVNVSVTGPVSRLLKEASTFSSAPEERLLLNYQGKYLSKNDKLEVYNVSEGGLVMVSEVPPPPSLQSPAAVELSQEDTRKFIVSFKTAIKSPSFSKVVKRLLEKENMDNFSAACPGLENDQLGKSFLTKPDLLTHLCDPETLSKIAKTHPCLLEAANNLAAAVHEEQQSAGRSGASDQDAAERLGGGSYYLDEMSDEEMETDDDNQRPQRSRSFTGGITPAQLAQALSMAAGIGQTGGNSNPFQGVTGLGVGANQRGSSQQQSQPNSTPNSASARITTDMFQQAMQQAMMASGMGQSPAQAQAPSSASQESDSGDLASKVERMREMGIIDEGLALQALQIMGGDLQAAVDLIFSGWEGGDDSMA